MTGKFNEPLPRLWLLFFGDDPHASWWSTLLRPGFRHIRAAAWYAQQERWVYFNPTPRGAILDLYREDEFTPYFDEMVRESTLVLRVASAHDLRLTPRVTYCVSALKAMLGLRSIAMTPYGFARSLVSKGAEVMKPEGPQLAAAEQHELVEAE